MRELAKRLLREKLLSSYSNWAEYALPSLGIQTGLSAHHRLLAAELQIAEKGNARTIVCFPPGTAKSTHISVLYPPWTMAKKALTVLACSYSYTLIEGFGRRARNVVDQHQDALGISLLRDSKSAGEWETTNGSRYFCAGVNAGIAGHRADLGLIDDPIGSDADARSQTYRDNQWKWFWDDFMPRLKPGGSVFILANRRHEDDLVGRLVATYPADWKVIKLPLIVETEAQRDADPLGRQIGQLLWPEWFNERTLSIARASENFSGLYQQDPTPESGDLIKAEWLVPYLSVDDLPKDLRIYVGSDHALTSKEENDANCLIPVGVDSNGTLWILPDVWWKRSDTAELVNEMLNLAQRRAPIVNWWAESEHIEKAIRPFLYERMRQRNIYFPITPLPSSKDLQARSANIRGMMQMCQVRFPVFAHWWHEAKHEMLSFPLGKHDDFVAALSEIGRGLGEMTRPAPAVEQVNEMDEALRGHRTWRPTFTWIRKSHEARQAALEPRYGDR